MAYRINAQGIMENVPDPVKAPSALTINSQLNPISPTNVPIVQKPLYTPTAPPSINNTLSFNSPPLAGPTLNPVAPKPVAPPPVKPVVQATSAPYRPPTTPAPTSGNPASGPTQSTLPAGWDQTTYNNFKAANPTLEPNAQDTALMQGAGVPYKPPTDPWAPDPNRPGYDSFGNPLQNYKPPVAPTSPNSAQAPTLNPITAYNGPSPQEIEQQLNEEKQRIQAKYDVQREQAKRDTENERQSNISSLYSVGEVNPLSSGVGSISGASSDILNRRLALIDQTQNAEISDATNRAYKAKSDYATNARQSQLDENTRIQQQYTDNRQALADSIAQVKAGQDRSDTQKKDSWTQTKDLLTTFGSKAFDGMDETALNSLETAAGLSKGTLVRGLKTIKEQELLGKSANLKEVDGSLYNVTTDSNGDLKATLVVKGTSKNDTGLTPAQINTTVNQIRSGFDNEPAVRNFVTVQEGYNFVQNVLNKTNPTSTDDQGLVYAFAKAMDPNSAVKEGEYTTVQKYSQSLIEKGWADAQRYVKNVAFLTPQARENMMATIKSKYDASAQSYNQIRDEYQRQIDDARAGKAPELTNYSTSGGQPDVRKAYESAGFSESYDDMVKQFGATRVQQILQEQGFLSP